MRIFLQKTLAALLVVTGFSFLGCGPTVVKSPDFADAKIRTLAMLPVEYPSDVRRERIDFLKKSLKRELESKGFAFLDDAAVSAFCDSFPCKNANALASKYRLDALVALSISSTYRANFGAGFVNTVSGTVRLLSPASREIISVKHTESERGGLLFNSGQVLQGLLSTNDNLGDESFNLIADRFVSTVSAALPKPSGPAFPTQAAKINEISILPEGDGRYRVCLTGTEGRLVTLTVDKMNIPLRESSAGQYCSALLLGGIVRKNSSVSASLRSPVGVSDRLAVDTEQFLVCDVSALIRRGTGSTLTYGCTGKDSDATECEKMLATCRGSQVLIYRGEYAAGPYEKAGTLPTGTWNDAAGVSKNYAVVAVSPNGSTSAVVPDSERK